MPSEKTLNWPVEIQSNIANSSPAQVPADLPPAPPPEAAEKLSKNFHRRDMDGLFSSVGWKIEQAEQIDQDRSGERWVFLVSRMTAP